MNLILTDQNTGDHYWTTAQCANYLGITKATWSSYTSRGQAPKSAGRFEKLTVWRAKDVTDWSKQRGRYNHG